MSKHAKPETKKGKCELCGRKTTLHKVNDDGIKCYCVRCTQGFYAWIMGLDISHIERKYKNLPKECPQCSAADPFNECPNQWHKLAQQREKEINQ